MNLGIIKGGFQRERERERLLEQQMAVTFDQDLKRCKLSNPSSECSIDYDPEDDCSDGGGLRLRDFFDCETVDFMAEFEFDSSANILFNEVKLAI